MATTIKKLNTRILLRFDTIANWTLSNPKLNAGEIALVEIPTATSDFPDNKTSPLYMFKVGKAVDGVNQNFLDLPWGSAKAADVEKWAKAKFLPLSVTSGESGISNELKILRKADSYTIAHAKHAAGTAGDNLAAIPINTASPSADIKIPKITTNEYGHITEILDTSLKIDLGSFATKAEISTAMVFKGTLGLSKDESSETAPTITIIPKPTKNPGQSDDTVGDTYKVIDKGVYTVDSSTTKIAAEAGDVIICNDVPEWVLVPSGDVPIGTVTSVAVGEGLALTNNETVFMDSGTIIHATPNGAKETDLGEASGPKFLSLISTDKFGHVTAHKTLKLKAIDTSSKVALAPNSDEPLYLLNTDDSFIQLHKISKTGKFDDLVDKPTGTFTVTAGDGLTNAGGTGIYEFGLTANSNINLAVDPGKGISIDSAKKILVTNYSDLVSAGHSSLLTTEGQEIIFDCGDALNYIKAI